MQVPVIYKLVMKIILKAFPLSQNRSQSEEIFYFKQRKSEIINEMTENMFVLGIFEEIHVIVDVQLVKGNVSFQISLLEVLQIQLGEV